MRVTIAVGDREVSFSLRADVRDYLLRESPPSRRDPRSEDLLIAAWAALKKLRPDGG